MMLYLLLNVKLRNLLQSCNFLCRNQISAAAPSAPVRTSSWCISEWVYCSSKLLGEAEQRRFRKKTKPNQNQKQQSYLIHELIFSEEEKIVKPQKKNSRLWTLDLFPAEYPYLAPDWNAGVRAQDSWDVITPFPFVMRKLWEDQARTDDLSVH